MRRSLIAIAALAFAVAAQAAEPTRTPSVGQETGENSAASAQIVDMARVKPGFGIATGNTVTINNASGIVTTASLTTAAGATQAITVNSTKIQAADAVLATVSPNGSTGTPVVANVTVTAGQAVVLLQNIHASVALNAAVKVMFLVVTNGNPN